MLLETINSPQAEDYTIRLLVPSIISLSSTGPGIGQKALYYSATLLPASGKLCDETTYTKSFKRKSPSGMSESLSFFVSSIFKIWVQRAVLTRRLTDLLKPS